MYKRELLAELEVDPKLSRIRLEIQICTVDIIALYIFEQQTRNQGQLPLLHIQSGNERAFRQWGYK